MGLFNRKKEKVEKLLTYGQRGLDNGDVFPSTYFLEEFFMSDREMEARYPKRFDCQIDSWNASFIRIGSSSYEATMLWSDRTWKKSIIVKHLIPMTPIGTTLHNGGIYVLLSKDSYDWGRTEYQDDGSERVTCFPQWDTHFSSLLR